MTTASDIRDRILQEHTALRVRLSDLERMVYALRTDASQLDMLRDWAREFLADLIEHTELEDAVVAPILREHDAWGSIRAVMLLEHHAQQREQLRELFRTYTQSTDPAHIARMTLVWIREIRADMHHEEADILDTTHPPTAQ